MFPLTFNWYYYVPLSHQNLKSKFTADIFHMLPTHQIAPSGATGESTTKSHKNNGGTGDSLWCDQSLRELGWLMVKKAQGNLINLYKSLEGVCREDRARLFPQTRGDGRKLNTGGTHFNNFETDWPLSQTHFLLPTLLLMFL